ncbi:MAG: glucose-6-phosphate dehydrogenase, partial [Candidatus Colwellbacteria bacterium]|nr:glucose-6-phosphate dehydrogenase [Candidatus Colwellbacteria bacterium]
MSEAARAEGAPAIVVVFGATGDLAAKKIYPALWHLFAHGRLPERFSVVGFARRQFSDEDFRALVQEAMEKTDVKADRSGALARFLGSFSYHAGLFEEEDAFISLASRIADSERAWGLCADKLFYAAVPPHSYEPIFKNLATAKLNLPCGGPSGWSRVLVEKPFGADRGSAKALQSLLSSYFKESQIYRIDHYLFKEIVQGIQHFRFSNNLFERAWESAAIERIDIRLYERVGVEDRGAFYDSVGALRDVGQNHLLAMLAAVTMNYPGSLGAEPIRRSRADILEMLLPWTEDLLRSNTFRAQYGGYRSIEGIARDSQTETYFALKTRLTHPKWRTVPITLEAGKRLSEARKEIVVTLKHPAPCLLCETGAHGPNTITFRLEPRDEIVIRFWTKKPGFERALEERSFSFFLYEKENRAQYVEEYAKVLSAALSGDQSLFMGHEEIDAMWRFVDPIVESWKRGAVPLSRYEAGEIPRPPLLLFDADRHQIARGDVGVIGLGKMGGNLARHLLERGWRVRGFNHHREATDALVAVGLLGAYSLQELCVSLTSPRVVWIMVPFAAVDAVLEELRPHLSPGDIVVDGGNSPYRESMRRGTELAKHGITFLDIGVSGGPGGARTGACM